MKCALVIRGKVCVAWKRKMLHDVIGWVARDVTKNQTKKLSILLSFYFH